MPSRFPPVALSVHNVQITRRADRPVFLGRSACLRGGRKERGACYSKVGQVDVGSSLWAIFPTMTSHTNIQTMRLHRMRYMCFELKECAIQAAVTCRLLRVFRLFADSVRPPVPPRAVITRNIAFLCSGDWQIRVYSSKAETRSSTAAQSRSSKALRVPCASVR